MKNVSLTEAPVSLAGTLPIPPKDPPPELTGTTRKRRSDRKIQDPAKLATIKRMRAQGVNPKEIAQLMDVSWGTIYRYLKEECGPTSGCKVCQWVSVQDEPHQLATEMAKWVHSGISPVPLFSSLKNHGLPASETTFRKHVRDCIPQEN